MKNNPSPAPVADWNWTDLTESLNDHGYAVTPQILSTADCAELITLYDQPEPWRPRVEPDRYRLGPGEYQHFDQALPETIAALREECYEHLAPTANDWHDKLGMSARFPAHLKEFIDTCHLSGQTNLTPLIQRHRAGGFHALHQELHEQHTFPLQLTIMLSKPGKDFTGGELMLVENLPRAQSRGHVIGLKQGQGVIWPARYRPGTGNRGHYLINVRNGISPLQTGTRHAMEIIFHDTA